MRRPFSITVLALGSVLASCGGDPVYAQIQQAQARFLDLDANYPVLRAGAANDAACAELRGEYGDAQANYELAIANALAGDSFPSSEKGAARYRHHGKAVLNDLAVTPGAVDRALTKARLCDPDFHTAQARNVSDSQKRRICREYGLTGCPGPDYEIDHLVSIELGGSNDDANLWPQPADREGVAGFHAKDVVENRAHRAVCRGEISLADAQDGIRRDWYGFGFGHGWIDGH